MFLSLKLEKVEKGLMKEGKELLGNAGQSGAGQEEGPEVTDYSSLVLNSFSHVHLQKKESPSTCLNWGREEKEEVLICSRLSTFLSFQTQVF